MTEYLLSYIPAIKSIIPQSSPTPSSLPELGTKPPSIPGINFETDSKPTLVAFVRHCGCPFAEKELNLLSEELKKDDRLRVVIVQHAEKEQTEKWFNEIGGQKLFPDASRYTLIPDPTRELYAKWGIGQLGWLGMINTSVMDNLKKLKESDGIDLRSTGVGSYRWQNSGGFAISKDGLVKWRKIAKDSSDLCDYAEAAQTII